MGLEIERDGYVLQIKSNLLKIPRSGVAAEDLSENFVQIKQTADAVPSILSNSLMLKEVSRHESTLKSTTIGYPDPTSRLPMICMEIVFR
jgi:hypothetical protein